MMSKTSFDEFAAEYDLRMGNEGDYIHQKTIDKSLFKIAGSITNKIVYDIGCGNGYIARKLIKKGAREVWASDISPSLISLAKNKYKTMGINYLIRDGSNFKKIPKDHFDLVVINMTIHYLPNLNSLFSNIADILKPGGKFVFTTDHPLHSLYYFDIGKINDVKVVLDEANLYRKEHVAKKQNYWDKAKILKTYHRPFSVLINSLSKNGLMVDGLIEPLTKRGISKTAPESSIPSKFAMSAQKMAT